MFAMEKCGPWTELLDCINAPTRAPEHLENDPDNLGGQVVPVGSLVAQTECPDHLLECVGEVNMDAAVPYKWGYNNSARNKRR